MIAALATCVFLFFSPSAVQAAAWMSSIVDCSTISNSRNGTFQVCSTGSFTSPSPAVIDGETFYLGGYSYNYDIVRGLKEGTETFSLSDKALEKAYNNGIVIGVVLDDNEKCSVTITVKEKSTVCSSCRYCGDETFSSNCTNVPKGRVVNCESTALGEVYFPMKGAAALLPAKVPESVVKPPTMKKPPMAPKPPKVAQKAPSANLRGPKAPSAPSANLRAPKAPSAPSAPKAPSAPVKSPMQIG